MIPFHRVLISTAIVFCAGFALWALWSWRSAGNPIWLVLAAAFFLAAVALGYYLRHLQRFLHR